MNLEKELDEVSKVSNGFKPMENLANKLVTIHTLEEIEKISYQLYKTEVYQIRMVFVFLFGKISALRDISKKYPEEILSEVSTWEFDNKKITQVKKLIMKNKNLLVI